MKAINYSLVQTIFALIIGIVLVTWPDAAANYLVITIGILFMIPGIITVISFFSSKIKNRFPIEGVGSILFGLWLVISPGFFVNILMYLLGIILMIGGIQQLYILVKARKWTNVPAPFFITPILILVAGIFILFSPRYTQISVFIIIGITAIFYAVSELFYYFRFINRQPKHPVSREITEAEIIDD